MSESQGLLNCCQPSDSEVKVMRSCESKIVMRQLSQQQSLGSEDLKVKWLVQTDHMTWILASDWSRQNKWPEYWPLIGPGRLRDLNSNLWLVQEEEERRLTIDMEEEMIRKIRKKEKKMKRREKRRRQLAELEQAGRWVYFLFFYMNFFQCIFLERRSRREDWGRLSRGKRRALLYLSLTIMITVTWTMTTSRTSLSRKTTHPRTRSIPGNTGPWLVRTDHVTWILASNWLIFQSHEGKVWGYSNCGPVTTRRSLFSRIFTATELSITTKLIFITSVCQEKYSHNLITTTSHSTTTTTTACVHCPGARGDQHHPAPWPVIPHHRLQVSPGVTRLAFDKAHVIIVSAL